MADGIRSATPCLQVSTSSVPGHQSLCRKATISASCSGELMTSATLVMDPRHSSQVGVARNLGYIAAVISLQYPLTYSSQRAASSAAGQSIAANSSVCSATLSADIRYVWK